MRSITILAAAIALAGFSLRADELKTKVEEEIGPSAENSRFWSVSADGLQVSQIKTIRLFQEYALCVNGKEIKRAEEFGDGAITFSPDGKHTAFFQFNARGGFAVINGKTTETFNTIAENSLRFTSDSKHVIFSINDGMAMVYNGAPFSGGITYDDEKYPAYTPDGNTMYCIGDAGKNKSGMVVNTKNMGTIERFPEFSENKNYFIYTVRKKDDKVVLAINDRELPLDPDLKISRIGVSNDGEHYVCSGKKSGKDIVLLDGKTVGEHDSATNGWISPDGAHVAYNYKNAGDKNSTIAIDNADLIKGEIVGQPRFSPDGKRFATEYKSTEKFPKYLSVVVDGKTPEIQGHGVEKNSICFSPDSSRLAYVITAMNHGKCVVVDGKSDPDFEEILIPSLHFSPDSKHVVYSAVKRIHSANPEGHAINSIHSVKFVVYDGKAHPLFHNVPSTPGEFFHSPDSRHFAYIAQHNNRKSSLVLNGVPGPTFDRILANTVIFSNDGNHIAYVASVLDNHDVPTYYVIMDGVLSLPYSTIFANQPLKPHFENDNAVILPVEEKGKIQRVRFYPPTTPQK